MHRPCWGPRTWDLNQNQAQGAMEPGNHPGTTLMRATADPHAHAAKQHAAKQQDARPTRPTRSPSAVQAHLAGLAGLAGLAFEITVWCCAVACTGQAQGVSGIARVPRAFSAAPAIRPAILHRRFDPLCVVHLLADDIWVLTTLV